MRRGKKIPENGTKIIFWSFSTGSLGEKGYKGVHT
jgi:hypothetical protein